MTYILQFQTKILLILLFSFVCIQSCITETERKELQEQKEYELKKEKLDRINDTIINSYVAKNSIRYNWDTINFYDFKYSIDFQTLIESKEILLKRFKLNDIYKIGENYFLSIETNSRATFYFKLLVSNDFLNDFRFNSDNIILIIHLDEIRKIQYSYEDNYRGSENKLIVKLNFEDDGGFIASGKIIDILTLKTLNNYESTDENVDFSEFYLKDSLPVKHKKIDVKKIRF